MMTDIRKLIPGDSAWRTWGINGARRTGKTWLTVQYMNQVARDHPRDHILYVTAERPPRQTLLNLRQMLNSDVFTEYSDTQIRTRLGGTVDVVSYTTMRDRIRGCTYRLGVLQDYTEWHNRAGWFAFQDMLDATNIDGQCILEGTWNYLHVTDIDADLNTWRADDPISHRHTTLSDG